MKRTHASLYYLASYLGFGGIALLAAPQFFVKLLLSNGEYPDVPLRFLGVMLVSLSIIVIQIIRRRVELMYATTLVVRLFICASLVGLYLESNDPLFLTLLAIVGVGLIITGTSYWLDKRPTMP